MGGANFIVGQDGGIKMLTLPKRLVILAMYGFTKLRWKRVLTKLPKMRVCLV